MARGILQCVLLDASPPNHILKVPGLLQICFPVVLAQDFPVKYHVESNKLVVLVEFSDDGGHI